MPAIGIERQDVGALLRRDIVGMLEIEIGVFQRDIGIAAMAIGAAQPHGGRRVHRKLVGVGVAGHAAFALREHGLFALVARRGRGDDAGGFVIAFDRDLAARRDDRPREQCQQRQQAGDQQHEAGKGERTDHINSSGSR